VVESLARQAEVLSEETDQPFEEAFAQVLQTPAGRRLVELAGSPAWRFNLPGLLRGFAPPYLPECVERLSDKSKRAQKQAL
jgi:hypothetical protein